MSTLVIVPIFLNKIYTALFRSFRLYILHQSLTNTPTITNTKPLFISRSFQQKLFEQNIHIKWLLHVPYHSYIIFDMYPYHNIVWIHIEYCMCIDAYLKLFGAASLMLFIGTIFTFLHIIISFYAVSFHPFFLYLLFSTYQIEIYRS